MSRARRRVTARHAVAMLALLAGVVAGAVTAGNANWRLVLLAALVALAVALTRLRYAAVSALAVLVVVAGLATDGKTAGADQRAHATAAKHAHPKGADDKRRHRAHRAHRR